jgi:hypothetical protein
MYQRSSKIRRAIGLWCIGLRRLHFASPAHSLSPEVTLTQLGHVAWRVQDGMFPGSPSAVAQTTDAREALSNAFRHANARDIAPD